MPWVAFSWWLSGTRSSKPCSSCSPRQVSKGEACPRNDALLAPLGVTSKGHVSTLFHALAKRGMIVLTTYRNGRDVFIPSLGKGTKPYAGPKLGPARRAHAGRPALGGGGQCRGGSGSYPGTHARGAASAAISAAATPRAP